MRNTRGLFVLPVFILFALAFSAGVFAADKAAGSYFAFVGTYTTGESKGNYAYRYDPKRGEKTSLGLAAEPENLSFVAGDPNRHFLYPVTEGQKYPGQAGRGDRSFADETPTVK